jgi:hypothetical protein
MLDLFAPLARAAGASELAYYLYISECVRSGNLAVCRYLVDNGADINSLRHDVKKGDLFTALHTAGTNVYSSLRLRIHSLTMVL